MIRHETILVTPEMARQFLAKNKVNRPLKRAHIASMARDMKRGRFVLTHQGIAVDEDGFLLDGQNRLTAIIEADTPVLMDIAYNVPREYGNVIDSGVSRSFKDALAFDGRYEDIPALRNTASAATVRSIIRNEFNDKDSHLSNDELFSIIGALSSYLTFLYDAATVRNKSAEASVKAAALAALLYGESRDDIYKFFGVYCNGDANVPNKNVSIVWNLNRQITDAKLRHRSIPRDVLYNISENAIWHFCRNSEVKTVKKTSEPRYPIKDKLRAIVDEALLS